MKKILLLAALLLGSLAGFAQTWDEWTQQKKTQIKYLMRQVAVNRVYIELMGKGYSIAKGGLTFIKDSKGGELQLHVDRFDGLRAVSASIRRSARISDILSLAGKIVRESSLSLKRAKLNADEMKYCREVFERLRSDCASSLEELMIVITHGALTMTDDERIKRIDKIYQAMQESYGFCSSFGNEMDLLSAQREGERLDVEVSKKINGLR